MIWFIVLFLFSVLIGKYSIKAQMYFLTLINWSLTVIFLLYTLPEKYYIGLITGIFGALNLLIGMIFPFWSNKKFEKLIQSFIEKEENI